MTIGHVLQITGFLFILLMIGAAFGWMNAEAIDAILLISLVSRIYSESWEGIIVQTVLATFAVFIAIWLYLEILRLLALTRARPPPDCYMWAMIASPNSDVFTLVAPSMRRSKS